ncbi:MAG: tRNA (adenosine(37)-N6)-threonylcarbamoyltransferase complex transferase subunit TsaD [Planctomycetes bacterium]|nr:tRNA (adenosine(37)-N6)-threonylcarbamoyltransferase complex transferase subunit TsaD [Planctomycetota bacterium]
MRVLGIESSCDETAAAVVEDGARVLSDVVASQEDLHAPYGGVVPEVAGRAHEANIVPVVGKALRDAGLSLAGLDGIAVTNRPGLVGSLLVGVQAAKSLALATGLPLVGVNHVLAHAHANMLCGTALRFPLVALVVSGGHTSLYLCRSPLEETLLGATVDDAAGEAFDKVAALLGLGFPGGPAVDRLAREGDRGAVRFPRTRGAKGTLDFSFSGLKTAVLYHLRGQDARPGKGANRAGVRPADVAASFQEALVDALVKVTLEGARRARVRQVVLGGGVAANGRLRERMAEEGAAAGFEVVLPPPRLCTDNGAMIAALGTRLLEAGVRDGLDLDVHPRLLRNPTVKKAPPRRPAPAGGRR